MSTFIKALTMTWFKDLLRPWSKGKWTGAYSIDLTIPEKLGKKKMM
jgi:hypothetical protein